MPEQQMLPGMQQHKQKVDQDHAISAVVEMYKGLISDEIIWNQGWAQGKRGKPVAKDPQQFQQTMMTKAQRYASGDSVQGVPREMWDKAHQVLEQHYDLWNKLWIMYQKAVEKHVNPMNQRNQSPMEHTMWNDFKSKKIEEHGNYGAPTAANEPEIIRVARELMASGEMDAEQLETYLAQQFQMSPEEVSRYLDAFDITGTQDHDIDFQHRPDYRHFNDPQYQQQPY